ncbi:FUSC family protein [Bosea sp. (in: a-proteobacteria)]|uniref:FUSC family protein n=1 Tax=Bosea sp. (in: a-proteobacteria) TaxID=1871050 RepID=UPI001ACE76BA|nr:FUSC family protein [Bosea sp. (in: a-proteobacteria)]MBN9436840.1 FUSC family protein [Bosea sp. (in: a-proteobacteria)]
MNPLPALARLGFDTGRLGFTLRTCFAACLALLAAWALGLEHPQWSAMTVFASAQPARNMLLEKAFFRGVGTLAGTAVGVVLMLLSGGLPLPVMLGLALWVGLCAFAGNLLRGFVSYGALIAGFSAAMVVLLDIGHPDHVLLLAADRLLTVLTGIVTALVVGLLFAPKEGEDAVAGEARQLAIRVLRQLTSLLSGTRPGAEEQRQTLRQLALLDEALEPHGAGSLRSRRSARSIRSLISALVSALVWLRTAPETLRVEPVGKLLEQAAGALEGAAPVTEILPLLEQAADLASEHPPLRDAILRLEAAAKERIGVSDGEIRPARIEHPVILHRDWVGARQAALRAGGIMLGLGTLWVVTGWQAGALLLLGTSVMVTLFSTWENPALIMRKVLVGQACGALAALACRWLVWPHATSELELVLTLMPFIMLGALPMAHRRTMLGSIDYCMALLLLSQPALPLKGDLAGTVFTALAVVSAPLLTLIAFRTIFPTDARQRLQVLAGMMLRELQDLCSAPEAALRAATWRARLNHRLLRLVRLSQQAGERAGTQEDGGIAVFAVGMAVLRLRTMLAETDLAPATAHAIRLALARIANAAEQPGRAVQALDELASRLDEAGRGEPESLRAASRALAAQASFFQDQGGRPDAAAGAPG